MGVGPHGVRGGGAPRTTKRKTFTCAITCKALTLVSSSVACFCLSLAPALAQEPPPLTPKTLESALTAKPQGPDADRLAERIRTYFGAEALLKGSAAPKIDDVTVAWAVELPQHPADAPPPRVVSDAVHFTMPLVKVGSGGLYVGVADLSHGEAFSWHFEAADRRLGGGQLEVYETHADSREKPGVPKGTTKQMPPWESKIFAGTRRDWWVYVPAQYRAESPAAVMVFQDGASYREYVPTVFDNLIAQGDMPVTVGIFVQPGTFEGGRSNRSFEYDTLSDQYARFLLEEILPEVEKTVKLRTDAASRAIAGRQQRRHLCLHRRLGATERIQQGRFLDRQLHEHRQRQDRPRRRP